jgi:SMODS and SLOG-associating 2TM effector domain 1
VTDVDPKLHARGIVSRVASLRRSGVQSETTALFVPHWRRICVVAGSCHFLDLGFRKRHILLDLRGRLPGIDCASSDAGALEAGTRLVQVQSPCGKRENADMALHHARGAIRRGPRIQVPRSEFRNHLQSLFEENKDTAKKMAADWSAEDQITPEMDRIRALSLEERKQCYAAERIQDQRVWYTRKAATNKRSARKWVAAGIAAYAIAAALAVGRVRLPDRVWPIGPVLVLASSILGWMQVKKFSELAATYTVAAHEIGLLRPKLDDVTSESELSDFVNDAELAFSREHTLWMARRTT